MSNEIYNPAEKPAPLEGMREFVEWLRDNDRLSEEDKNKSLEEVDLGEYRNDQNYLDFAKSLAEKVLSMEDDKTDSLQRELLKTDLVLSDLEASINDERMSAEIWELRKNLKEKSEANK